MLSVVNIDLMCLGHRNDCASRPARGDPPIARGDFLLLHCITSHAVVPLAIFNDYGLLGCFFFWLVHTRDRGGSTRKALQHGCDFLLIAFLTQIFALRFIKVLQLTCGGVSDAAVRRPFKTCT